MSFSQDLDRIALQEQELHFSSFDSSIAWNFGRFLYERASSRKIPVVLDIRRFGHPLFYIALEGASPDNFEWARRKANVVQRFLRSSYAMGLMLKRDQTNLFDKFGLTLADYAAHGGAFPLSVAGVGAIGAITVSGLPQRADHEFIVEALCAFLQRDYSDFALDPPPAL